MININKVLVQGNVVRDPELKAIAGGTSVCQLSVATNFTSKNADGSKKETAEFHNIVVFGKQAESTAQYMKKGSEVLIEGRIQTRSYDKDGAKVYRTEIIADRVQFGSGPKTAVSAEKGTMATVGKVTAEPSSDISVDDIPF